MTDLVEQNPAASRDTHFVGLNEHELVRVDLLGQHPDDSKLRLCVIGIGDEEDRAKNAANGAWFDYPVAVLFMGKLAACYRFRARPAFGQKPDPTSAACSPRGRSSCGSAASDPAAGV